MTRDEWQAELVRLGKRMAQAAQAIVIEIEGARGAESARIDRIDATARALFAAGLSRAGYVQPYGVYENAEALEEARAEWLAKRGQR